MSPAGSSAPILTYSKKIEIVLLNYTSNVQRNHHNILDIFFFPSRVKEENVSRQKDVQNQDILVARSP
jgi:hypothetical protein